MNAKFAKKLRKMTRRSGREYLKEIKEWPFINRLGFAWFILFGDKRKV